MKSEHPVLAPLLAQLCVGGGKVSGAKVREFVQEFNIGLERGLSPGTHTRLEPHPFRASCPSCASRLCPTFTRRS